METCRECGKPPRAYIHCDRWDCPLLGLRHAQKAVMPDTGDRVPIDEDDDEVAVDWDENAQWPEEDDDDDDDEDD